MLTTATTILLPLVVALVSLFLILRLRLFADEGVSGRYAFLAGSIILVGAATWQAVKQTGAYSDWFVASAYPWLDLAHFVALLIGLALAVAGVALYADHWQTRREDLEVRDQKLSILDNLQRDARGPYQLLELLNISIKEIISQMPECAGAVFLINRKRRQFVLTSSVGLRRDETALLEYYPLQRNIVSQSIDLGEPTLGGQFSFIDREGAKKTSRFQSCLVLPLVSGMTKIGGILLLSEREHDFGRSEIRYLQPVAEWIAEKIKSARLERDLSASSERVEAGEKARADLTRRLRAAAAAFASAESVDEYCRSLVGLAESRTAHLFGLVNGSLRFHGGSEPIGELSENFRTALVEALDRRRPLVINQEAVTESGQPYVARSNLVVPVGETAAESALLLRREDTPFAVGEDDLQALSLFADMARLLLQQIETRRLDLGRRKGFEAVLELMRFDTGVKLEEEPAFFLSRIAPVLPHPSVALMFLRETRGAYRAAAGLDVDPAEIEDLTILPGEGIVGEVANRSECRFAHGRAGVARLLDTFESDNRDQIRRLFGQQGIPGFLAVCPLQRRDNVAAVALFTAAGLSENERAEWERLLTLASSLYSVRLTIAELSRQASAVRPESVDRELLGQAVNQLNNHLSAVVGNAELAFTRTNLSGDVEQHLRSILHEAERAAAYLKESLGKLSAPSLTGAVETVPGKTIGQLLRDVLRRLRVAENLYLAGGRAREINVEMKDDQAVPVGDEKLLGLIEETLNRFGSAAEDDDVITATVYRRGDFLHLDLSRHRKNFPPVEQVAGFGTYGSAGDVLSARPSDTFLRYIAETRILYAYDRVTQPPSYLSFKFPLSRAGGEDRGEAAGRAVRVLAVDDQTVILDLVSAMCQSLGYEVDTASSGTEGVSLAREHEYTIVLTDLAMPGMSGLETAAEIRKLQPKVPVVLVTGWEVNIEPAQLESAGISHVLYKPFRIEQLTDIIRSAATSPSNSH